MLKIKLSVLFPEWPYFRQTPQSQGIWGDCQFFIKDQPQESYDFWVVHDGLLTKTQALCSPKNTLLITAEPPHHKTYHPEFLKQFAAVITCDPHTEHPHVIPSQQGLPWMVGRNQKQHQNLDFKLSYDELHQMQSFKKTKLISMVVSNKTITAGHQKRLDFIEFLKKQTRVPIDIYGHGINEISDKWDAIAPYRYHLVLENGVCPDYWTEKLADCYLGSAYPIYWGCPNLEKYFSKESYTPLNLNDFEIALKQIEKIIADNTYEIYSKAIQKSRQLVLDQYNLFAMISTQLQNWPKQFAIKKTTLFPESHFTKPALIQRIKQKILPS